VCGVASTGKERNGSNKSENQKEKTNSTLNSQPFDLEKPATGFLFYFIL